MRSRFSSRVMVVHLVVLSLDCFQRHLVTRDALYLRVVQVFDTLSFVRQAAAPTNNLGRCLLHVDNDIIRWRTCSLLILCATWNKESLGGVFLCFAIRYSSRVCLFAFASKCMMPAFAYAGLLAYVGGLNACANVGGCGER